jgi:catechol 2,3-dioxygenase-like lactoylglutathione lyase family enzyme
MLDYGGTGATLTLRQAKNGSCYTHRRTDRYWKIGITLPNLDIAHAQLQQAGIAVSNPSQFNDIGYMCHLTDPEGFAIELLQHSFLDNRDPAEGDPDKALGGGALIGQITLRVTDVEKALAFYRGQLGMRLLSIQPVDMYGFTLYFLAFTDERSPNAGLEAVENREWLWRRPYSTLELQHLHDAGKLDFPNDDDPGFHGIVISGDHRPARSLRDEAGGKVFLTG